MINPEGPFSPEAQIDSRPLIPIGSITEQAASLADVPSNASAQRRYLGSRAVGAVGQQRPTIMERWGEVEISEVFDVLRSGMFEFEPESEPSLERFRPDTSRFPRPELDGLHDKGHLLRTLIWLKPVASLLPQERQRTIDWDVLRAAAVLHDVGRQGHERNAHAHGKRGKELLEGEGVLRALLPKIDADTQNPITEVQVRGIAYLIENHHEFDHDAADIDPRMRTMLTVLQTADGLDLARGFHIHGKRFGERILDRSIRNTGKIDDRLKIIKHTLRIPGAEQLRQAATVYATETRERIDRGEGEYESCVEVAIKVGLVTE